MTNSPHGPPDDYDFLPLFALPSRPQPSQVFTSDNNPIEVDWVKLPARVSGQLGITFAPGKCGPAATPHLTHLRDLDKDLERLSLSADVLANCMEEAERVRFGIGALAVQTAQHGMRFVSCPVRDLQAPRTPQDRATYHAHVQGLVAAIQAGQRVVVTCRGGKGRAGTLAAAILIELGFTARQALALVRAHREGAIETTEQETFLGINPVRRSRQFGQAARQ